MDNEEIEKTAKKLWFISFDPNEESRLNLEKVWPHIDRRVKDDYFRLAKWHLEQVASLTARLAEAEKDGKRLEWVFKLIEQNGTNGVANMNWTLKEDGGDMEFILDRQAIDAAMEGGK